MSSRGVDKVEKISEKELFIKAQKRMFPEFFQSFEKISGDCMVLIFFSKHPSNVIV